MFTPELVDAAVVKHGRSEQRRRLLPARLVVYFVLGLCLFARESYEEVVRMLTSGIPGSRALAKVNRSSLCRARNRLGEEVLETVFRQVAGPLATLETPGAWWRGLRLLALDGTQFDVPDSVSNGDTFDGPSTGGTPFGFPQVRAAVLAEIGTHAVLDAGLGGYRDGERRLAYPLASSTGPGDLVVADRGFWSVEFVNAFTSSGAHLLVRLQSNHLGTTQADLPDGSRLSLMRPGKDVRLRAAREGRVLPKETTYRVITFTKDDKVGAAGGGGPGDLAAVGEALQQSARQYERVVPCTPRAAEVAPPASSAAVPGERSSPRTSRRGVSPRGPHRRRAECRPPRAPRRGVR
ncbi:hypothetical protein SFUMM280S_00905 [Streptomyces fumanus]